MKHSIQSILWVAAVVLLSMFALNRLDRPESPVPQDERIELKRQVMLVAYANEEFPGKTESGSYATTACDSLLVPHEITVVSPRLKSILTALSEYDPPEGLYNMMKDQGFIVADVVREPGSTKISLKGNPELSGLCDRTQLKDQIERTVALHTNDVLEFMLNAST